MSFYFIREKEVKVIDIKILIHSSIVLLLFALLLCPSYLQASQTDVGTDIPEIIANVASDGTKDVVSEYEPRVPSKIAINKFKQQHRFNYKIGEDTPPADASWLDYAIYRAFSFLLYLMHFPLVKILLIILVATLVIWWLVRIGLIDNEVFSKNRKLNRSFKGGLNDIEDTLEYNFDILIEKAVKEKNYRSATRLHFLKNLKALSDKDLIHWDKQKTNNNYINEISDQKLRKEYATNALIFDYVWYGELNINESEFKEIHHYYDEFHKNVMSYAAL